MNLQKFNSNFYRLNELQKRQIISYFKNIYKLHNKFEVMKQSEAKSNLYTEFYLHSDIDQKIKTD